MKKCKIFFFILGLGLLINIMPSFAQSCQEEVSGTIECLDYKGRVVDSSICNTHVSIIGTEPPTNTVTCPVDCDSLVTAEDTVTSEENFSNMSVSTDL